MRVVVTLGGVSEVSDGCYLRALTEAGLEPVALYPSALAEEVRAAVRESAGLVLSGGADVHPSCYGEEPAGAEMKFVSEARDGMELAALAEADSLELPVLAICRGMQMLNVHRGGALLQDIGQEHRDGRAQDDKWMSWHVVDVLAGSRLAELFPEDHLFANSRHHQAVDEERVGAGLHVTGWAAWDDTVEAVEGEDAARFVLGVQWHPENMAIAPEDCVERRQAGMLFGAFAGAVREYAALRS